MSQEAEQDLRGAFCAVLPQLREECTKQSADQQHLLRRIEIEARAQRPIIDLLAQLGITSADVVRGLSTGLPGAGPGQADEERFSCPAQICNREAPSLYPGGPIPRCALNGDCRMIKD
ncbi:MAG: hypothetical protein ACRDTE_03455 [Pseudonocardiaceae bacterium]